VNIVAQSGTAARRSALVKSATTEEHAPTAESRPCGAFSIDLEDFSQLICKYRTNTIPDVSVDVDRQLDVVLSLLAEYRISGTFFVLGLVAARRPDLVRKVQDAGHEIATHGTNHVQAFRQGRDEFKRDVGGSIKVLEDITGQPVLGYRAPQFSIVRENLWALDVLAELGLQYDSSIFPMRLKRYGIASFDPQPRRYRLPEGGRLVEIPMHVARRGGRSFPVAGGGYLRLMPAFVLRRVVAAARASGRCFTLYLHPYEFDPFPLDVGRSMPPDQPIRFPQRTLLNAKWNLRRRSILKKARWMCANIAFATYAQLAKQVEASQPERPLPTLG
jgi:polysaccharide deacetylase family protein (PEP-CTERM system associated)